MAFSSKILGIICFSLLLIPVMVYAESYSVKVDNKTITIVVNSNNTVNIPSQNNTKLEQAVEKIANKEESQWKQGDIIVSSSTLVAFLGFGTFLSFKFESKRQIELVQMIFACIGTIVLFHLTIILEIVNDVFDKPFYNYVIVSTIVLIMLILIAIVAVIRLKRTEIASENFYESAYGLGRNLSKRSTTEEIE